MLNSVRNATSDIHSFRHSTILYTNSTICIHLNDVKRPFSRTVKFPSDVCTGHKYFITNLVVIVYPETIFPGIVGINDFLFSKPGSCGKSVIFPHLVGFHSSRQNIY